MSLNFSNSALTPPNKIQPDAFKLPFETWWWQQHVVRIELNLEHIRLSAGLPFIRTNKVQTCIRHYNETVRSNYIHLLDWTYGFFLKPDRHEAILQGTMGKNCLSLDLLSKNLQLFQSVDLGGWLQEHATLFRLRRRTTLCECGSANRGLFLDVQALRLIICSQG